MGMYYGKIFTCSGDSERISLLNEHLIHLTHGCVHLHYPPTPLCMQTFSIIIVVQFQSFLFPLFAYLYIDQRETKKENERKRKGRREGKRKYNSPCIQEADMGI